MHQFLVLGKSKGANAKHAIMPMTGEKKMKFLLFWRTRTLPSTSTTPCTASHLKKEQLMIACSHDQNPDLSQYIDS
jgi:hypothetical protein